MANIQELHMGCEGKLSILVGSWVLKAFQVIGNINSTCHTRVLSILCLTVLLILLLLHFIQMHITIWSPSNYHSNCVKFTLLSIVQITVGSWAPWMWPTSCNQYNTQKKRRGRWDGEGAEGRKRKRDKRRKGGKKEGGERKTDVHSNFGVAVREMWCPNILFIK